MHLIEIFNRVAMTALLIATSSLVRMSSQSEYDDFVNFNSTFAVVYQWVGAPASTKLTCNVGLHGYLLGN